MAVIAVDGVMDVGARLFSVRRSKLVLSIVAAAVALAVIGFAGLGAERLWTIHVHDAALRSGVETTITVFAFVTAGLLLAHFRRTRVLRDLLLLAALVTASLTDFIFNTLPAYVYQTGVYGAGARMGLSILLAGILVVVAFAPVQRRVDGRRRIVIVAVAAALYWVALGELADLVLGPAPLTGPSRAYAPIAVVVALVAFTLLVTSACGFATRHERGDRDAGLLAVVAILMAGSQLSKLSLPVVPADWVVPADAFRVSAYGLLLVVGLRLYRRSVSQAGRDALTAERQRVVRDLQHGLAQDLALIATHSGRLAEDYGNGHPLTIAASRAVGVSHGVLVDLDASTASTTEAAVRDVAGEMSRRFGVDVTVRTETSTDRQRSARDRNDLVRIAREAIGNAVRHGGASNIAVTIGAGGGEVLLRVADDGRGFGGARAETAGTGLGLRTMRDRARRLGADLKASRSPSGGAEIDVVARTRACEPIRSTADRA